MKKLFFLSALAVSFMVNSQTNTFPTTGNVGIGTTTPTEDLEVVGTILGKQLFINDPLPDGSSFIDYDDRNEKCIIFGGGTKFNSGQYTFNVWDFPASNLDAQARSSIVMEDRNWKSRWGFYARTGGSSQLNYYDKNQSSFFRLNEDGSNNVLLLLPKINSYVTIGTNSYNDNGELYKLTVNGKVRAHAVKVYTDWADFVFEDDYKLPTLEEVEAHIKLNGHLKDIPSAEDVEKNGIELGEMNKLLLQKIEELTLYTIELKKEVDILKSKME